MNNFLVSNVKIKHWAVVVDDLVEWSLPTPEVRGWNPVIGNKLH